MIPFEVYDRIAQQGADEHVKLAVRQLKSLTEHAVAAQLTADEMHRKHPDTSFAIEARGEAHGWRLALLLMGGTMPVLGGAA